jgi:hypothetical protein
MSSSKYPTRGIMGTVPSVWPERERTLRFHAEGCDFGDGKSVIGKMVIDPGGFVTVKIYKRHKRWTLPLREAISALAIAGQRREFAKAFGGRTEPDVSSDSGHGDPAEDGGSE